MDPEAAQTDFLRGAILAQWEELGLKSLPDTGDDGVHVTTSPFVVLTGRANWLGYRADRSPFDKLTLKTGVSRKEWSNDLQVMFGVLPMNQSIFDIPENTTSDLSRSLPIDYELRRCLDNCSLRWLNLCEAPSTCSMSG